MPYPPDYQNATWFLASSTKPAYGKYPALSDSFGGTKPFTVAAWVRAEGTNGQVIGSSASQPVNWIVTLAADGSSTFQPLIYCGNLWGWNYLTATWANTPLTVAFPLRTWVHVAVTFDGTTLTLYYNGAPVKSAAPATTASVLKPVFSLGANATNPPKGTTAGLLGGLRGFGYWTVCMTSEEIARQMWSTTSAVPEGAQIVTDFAVSPPGASTGPSPVLTNSQFKMDSYGLQSMGVDVASPGDASVLNPSAAAPFSIIAWVAGGTNYPKYQTTTTSQGTFGEPEASASAPYAEGCFFSNGDATDPGSMAVSFAGGVPTVTFGDGQSVAASVKINERVWNAIAVTYDGTTCTIYVNGEAKGAKAITPTAAPAPLPRLMGQLRDGTVTNAFTGILQYLSVWDVALTAEEVAAWENEDPTDEPHCVADFGAASEPAQDLVPIENEAVWDSNVLLLGESIAWISTQNIPPDLTSNVIVSAAPPRSVRRGEDDLPPIRRVHLPRVPPRRKRAAAFSAEHKAKMRGELERALGAIDSPELQQRLRAEYGRELDELFDDAASGRRKPPRCRMSRDGNEYVLTDNTTGLLIMRLAWQDVGTPEKPETLITIFSAAGDVTARLQVDSAATCAAWWARALYTLIAGVCDVMGWPTPVERLGKVVAKIVADEVVIATLTTMIYVTFTATVIIRNLSYLNEMGYLQKVVHAILHSLTWWAATYLLVQLVWLVAPVPNAKQIIVIIHLAKLALEIADLIEDYSDSCLTTTA